MQTLTDHVTSLELSQKLAEAGFKQDSLFYWAQPILTIADDYGEQERLGPFELVYKSEWPVGDRNNYNLHIKLSAYTASELANLLPTYLDMPSEAWPVLRFLHIIKCATDSSDTPDTYTISYIPDGYPIYDSPGDDENMANAIAKRIFQLRNIEIFRNLMELPK